MKKIKEALALLNSMLHGGESHTKKSIEIFNEARKELKIVDVLVECENCSRKLPLVDLDKQYETDTTFCCSDCGNREFIIHEGE